MQTSSKDEIIVKKILDLLITSRRLKDGYVNGVEICKLGKKKIEDWLSLHTTNKLITEVCERQCIERSKLVEREFIHYHLGIKLAIWISDNFSSKVDEWITQLIENKLQPFFLDERDVLLENILHSVIFIESDEKFLDDHDIDITYCNNIFDKGSCLYIISDFSDRIQKYKLDFCDNINTRLYKEKKINPNIKLELLTYTNSCHIIKKSLD